MSTQYSNEEIARRGDEFYDRNIRAEVEGKQDGEVVAIDVDTGEHTLGEMGWSAAEPLLSKNPDAEIWLVRVGQRSFVKFGRRGLQIGKRQRQGSESGANPPAPRVDQGG